ncbi:unnamed protein product [Pseudo-nitzschia multistriata]|uniref:Uncharacterized protein n=1 Tax=Pseudo-nitzschia multistriata TaxID=183589 RepID=A0A448ZAG2_9STRA|nr:unnamed protein product [Pseudo-nitzschia multistriata]
MHPRVRGTEAGGGCCGDDSDPGRWPRRTEGMPVWASYVVVLEYGMMLEVKLNYMKEKEVLIFLFFD